jgi:23S rRNA maturation mini-RNase III
MILPGIAVSITEKAPGLEAMLGRLALSKRKKIIQKVMRF